jgi:flagellar basal-body rod protein FlgG
MNVSLYQAAAAMNVNARWQDLIAQNLVASSVPGARKQEMSFTAVEAALARNPAGQNVSHHLIPTGSATTNFEQGELEPTKSATDFAIQGPGFLEVQLPNGSQGYSRDGKLHLNTLGQLVTKQGYTVLGDSGPLQLDPNNPSGITVTPTGEVSQDGKVKGHIKLVEFNQPRLLTAIGAGCFVASNPQLQSTPAQSSTLRQGFLETTNIATTTEMASMITAMRSFEANQKVMQMQDDRMGKVISDLGNPS